jgi:NifB/MoaA-like Fe-S oxidoreductase
MAISLDFNPISTSGSGRKPVDITEEIEKMRIKEMSFHL